jgi:hypothetical protein
MLCVFVFGLLQDTFVKAQAVPVQSAATYVMNRFVGQMLTSAAVKRGIAANDPVFLSTLASVSAKATSLNTAATVAGVGLAIAGAPMWLGIAASLGVVAVGSALIAGNATLTLNQGSISISQASPQPTPYSPLLTDAASDAPFFATGGQIYRTDTCIPINTYCSQFPAIPSNLVKNFIFGSGQTTTLRIFNTLQQINNYFNAVNKPQFADRGEHWTWDYFWMPNTNGNQFTLFFTQQGEQLICAQGACNLQSFTRTESAESWIVPNSNVRPLAASDLGTISPSISPSTLAQPLPAAKLAQLANSLWQAAAASPNYQGMPYSATNPITAADVQAWLAANPSLAPTLGDLLTPASATASSAVVISPTVQTSTGTSSTPTASLTDVNVVNTPNVNVINKISVDLGVDPGVGSPTLETTPTAQMILAPILGLFPTLRSFVVPAHTGVCPKPTFSAFNRNFVMDTHCTMFENHRSSLYSTMILAFVLAAVFIVLSA